MGGEGTDPAGETLIHLSRHRQAFAETVIYGNLESPRGVTFWRAVGYSWHDMHTGCSLLLLGSHSKKKGKRKKDDCRQELESLEAAFEKQELRYHKD